MVVGSNPNVRSHPESRCPTPYLQLYDENQSLNSLILQVTNVRNQIMHSASFAVSAEDFQDYMSRIRALGEALGKKVTEFQSFSTDMAEVGAASALCSIPKNCHNLVDLWGSGSLYALTLVGFLKDTKLWELLKTHLGYNGSG